jgi:flavin reductase (DIM6/NTAB) family NADH-FMN oxidoreductase RutF
MEVIPYALWVCSTGSGGRFSSIVVTWVTQLSFSPQLVGMALETDSEFLHLVGKNGSFTLAMLPRDGGKDTAKRIMKAGATPLPEDFAELFRTEGPWYGTPHGALGAIRCTVNLLTPAGDHTLVTGAVVGEERWIEGNPLHLSDTGWRYTKPGADAPPPQSQD